MKSLQEVLLDSVLKEAKTSQGVPFIPSMLLAFSHILYDITNAGSTVNKDYNKSDEGFIGIITKMMYSHFSTKPKDSFEICLKEAQNTKFSVNLYERAKFIDKNLRSIYLYRGLYECTQVFLKNQKLVSIAENKYVSSKKIVAGLVNDQKDPRTFEQAIIEALGSNSHLTEAYQAETLTSYIIPHILALFLQLNEGRNFYHNMGKEAIPYLTRKLSIELRSIKDTSEKGNTKEEKVNTVINDIIDAFRVSEFTLDYFNTTIKEGKTIPLVLAENWENIFAKRGIFHMAKDWVITPKGRGYLNRTLGNAIRIALQ